MTDPIPDEAVEAGVAEMFDHGWTCEYHEPDDSCETCRKAHKSTVHDILTAAAPYIAAQAEAVDTCVKCNTSIHWIDCPTGGWWAHQDHPDDGHDAQTVADLMTDRDWWKSTCKWWAKVGTDTGHYRDMAVSDVKRLEAELSDLRAGIEAARDEWRERAASLRAVDSYAATLCDEHADALDALLRERAR